MHETDNGQPRVSVLIVNYNGRHILEACLQSVARRLSVPHEVIVCDNGSQDGSVAYLRAAFPEVRVVVNPANAGFAAGNNAAAALARGEYLLLLNTDTIVEDELAPLVARLEADPSIGVLGCRLSYRDGSCQESIGQEASWWRLWAAWLPLPQVLPGASALMLTTRRDDPRYAAADVSVPWLSGAMMLLRRDLWERLGGMDAGYFMYFEDVAFCEGVRRAGLRVAYSASARVTHFKSGGRPWIGRETLEHLLRSHLLFSRRHYGVAATTALRALLAVALTLRSVAFAAAALRRPGSHRGEQAAAHLAVAAALASGRLSPPTPR